MTAMLAVILLLSFFCITAIVYIFLPSLASKAIDINQKQAQKNVASVDMYLADKESQNIYRLTIMMPLGLAILGFIFLPDFRFGGVVAGLFAGFIFPRMYANRIVRTRKEKFNEQLVNGIMIMSSSFRGGLSLIQAIEAVVDEMPDPIKREFGIVLGENKMGVALDDGLNRLYKRMPSIALQQMITAILLARETGGNLPAIFSRIVSTMRERKKIEGNLKTLTVQGKIQAVVMTLLPVGFVIGVSASNPHFFDTMLKFPDGRQLLGVAVVLWVLGAFFIWQISKLRDF